MRAGGFDGVRQAAAQAFLEYQPVHHQLDIMLFVFLALDLLGQVVENAVHPDAGKPLLPRVLKNLDVLALLGAHHRGHHHKLRSRSQRFHPIHNLVDGLAADLPATLRAVGNAHPRPEQPEVIVYFRHGSHRGAGILGGGLLVDGNGRGQAVNSVHIGLVHLTQKLPGIGAETLHIPPLSLGKNGVEGQTGLARAGQAGKHHQFVSGDGQIHILQIILPRAPNSDCIVHNLLLFDRF